MKYIKNSLKIMLAGILGILVFISSNSGVEAYTSDEVTLSVAKPGAGYVTTQNDPLRVRKSPSTSAEVITTLPKDSMIMIVGRINDFYKIQYDTYGNYGYVSSQYLREYDLDAYGIANTSTSLNMRAGSGTSYGIVGSIPSKRSFAILTNFLGWDYVLYGN